MAIVRYSDLTVEELAESTQEQIDHFIELELAFAGVATVTEPKKPDYAPVDLKPTVEAYEVGGLVFSKQEDANKVAAMSLMETEYDYRGAGYNYRWIKPRKEVPVTTVRYYTEEQVKKFSETIKNNNKLKEAYEAEQKLYDKFIENSKSIREEVVEAYTAALRRKQNIINALALFQKYLSLAEQDVQIAKNFFAAASKYDDEINEIVYREYNCETPATVKEDESNE